VGLPAHHQRDVRRHRCGVSLVDVVTGCRICAGTINFSELAPRAALPLIWRLPIFCAGKRRIALRINSCRSPFH
jgi:hypothetical protein